jgi:hypothetical protein
MILLQIDPGITDQLLPSTSLLVVGLGLLIMIGASLLLEKLKR